MKKISFFVFVLMIICLMSGCKGMKGYNTYESVYKTYNEMESYSATVCVTAYSNNSENKYTLKQFYKAPDMQRSEYVSQAGGGSITVINGDKGKIFSDYSSSPVALEKVDIKEKDYLMLQTFFKIYYSSEETAVTTSGNNSKGKITLVAQTGDSNPYKKTAELIIDKESLKPIEMTITGFDGKPSLRIEYNEFELNPELDNKLFE